MKNAPLVAVYSEQRNDQLPLPPLSEAVLSSVEEGMRQNKVSNLSLLAKFSDEFVGFRRLMNAAVWNQIFTLGEFQTVV